MSNAIDQAVHDWIVDHRGRWLTDVAWRATDLGTTPVTAVLVLAVGTVLAVQRRRWVPLAACAAADVATEAVARWTKWLVGRDRPPAADALQHLAHSSFPAGHVGRAALTAALVTFAVPPRWRRRVAVTGGIVVAAVAWSRVYLGAHWLTDTLAAWPIGVGFALAARRWWSRQEPEVALA